MKKVGIVFAILICLFALSSCMTWTPVSSIKEESKVITDYTGTKSKDELFALCNEWLLESFNNPESVITYSDKESGVLMGSFNLTATQFLATVYAEFNLKIECKDNKVKMTVSSPTDVFTFDTYLQKHREQQIDVGTSEAFIEKRTALFKTLEAKVNKTFSSNW